MAGKSTPMALIGAIFSSMYHTKQLNPWPTSPVSHLMIYYWLSACPGDMVQFKDYPNTHGLL